MQKFLENVFEPSSIAASAVGPNALMPISLSLFLSPLTRGTSGPIITRLASINFAKLQSASILSTGIFLHSPSFCIPGFPGAINNLLVRGEFFIALAIACSLPPLPINKIIIFLFPKLFLFLKI